MKTINRSIVVFLFAWTSCTGDKNVADKKSVTYPAKDKAKKTVQKEIQKPENGIKSVLKSNSTERDFKEIRNQGFVISCGTGCAMAHNVKEIEQVNPASVKVIFEVEMYVDGELTETFDETYIFHFGNINTIEHIVPNGKNENIEQIFAGASLQSFKEFSEKLIQ